MIESVQDESALRLYPVDMTTRYILSLIFAVILPFITGCDSNESANSSTESSSTELKAVVSTERGEFTILLRPDLTPVAVANFVNLAQSGFYHGSEVANANAASFSVANTKYKTPNYTIVPEFTTELLYDRPGIVAWTLMDDPKMVENFIPHPTRFFVTKSPQSPWNLTYPSFGEVVDGIGVVSATQKSDWIKSIRIVGDADAALAPHADKIAAWNEALENAKPSANSNNQKGVPLPEDAKQMGF